jgi:hypothetical protein
MGLGQHCAYCGKVVRGNSKKTRDHVVPDQLFRGTGKTSAQRPTVRACLKCNNGWSNDEVHFRNVLALSGEPNSVVRGLWDGPIRRSLDKEDGHKRALDLVRMFVPADAHPGRQMIYPARDSRVMRIVRKVVRGLCHYFEITSPVADRRVHADVLRWDVPRDILDSMAVYECEREIFRCRFQMLGSAHFHSLWILTFFENKTFIAVVSASPKGFSKRLRATLERGSSRSAPSWEP